MVQLSEVRKVKSTTVKLSGQASQYWTNLENIRVAWGQLPTNT